MLTALDYTVATGNRNSSEVDETTVAKNRNLLEPCACLITPVVLSVGGADILILLASISNLPILYRAFPSQ